MSHQRALKSELIRNAIRAGGKALLRNLALTAAVLGPGLLLVSVNPIAGMIWLFCGSFGLMAWTYRKPWRLMWISCLAPAAGSALCYGVQLILFGAPPLDMMMVACILGMGFGYWRADAHQFYTEGQAVMARRTVEYLLIWAAAYGATQVFGFMGRTRLAHGGLLTGAFTTSMLMVVSVMIFMRFREMRASLGVMLLLAVVLAPSPGLASDYYWELREIRLDDYYKDPKLKGIVQFTETSFVVQDRVQRISFSWTLPEPRIVRPGEAVQLTMHCRYERLDASFRINSNNNIKARILGFDRPPGHKKFYVGWIDFTNPGIRMRQHPNLTFIDTMHVSMIAPQKPDDRIVLQFWLELQEVNPYGASPEGFTGIGGEIVKFVYEQVGGPEPSPLPGGSAGDGGGVSHGGGRRGGGPPPFSPWNDPDTLKKLVLSVSLILVGVGICINVAQAVAAAVAQALQAGVEITVQDIWDELSRHRAADRRKTVTLQGDEARKVLRRGIGTRVSLDDEQRHDIYLDSGTDTYAEGDFGPEGRVASVGSVLESENGDVLVSVEVERDEPMAALSAAAESEARGKLDGLLSGLGSESGAPQETDGTAARDAASDAESLKGAAEKDARQKLAGLLGDGRAGRDADDPSSAAASVNRAGASADSAADGGATEAQRMKTAAESEARRKLNELLGGEPADQKDEKPPAIPSVPAALSDNREPGGDGPPVAGENEARQRPGRAGALPGQESARDRTTGPVFGEGLEVDAQGRVKYGEQWLPQDEALQRIAMDREWRAAQEQARMKVDAFRRTVAQLDNTKDPDVRDRLQESLVRQAAELNSDYAAKTMLKPEGANRTNEAFDRAVHNIYERVDQRTVEDMNARGYRRGGRDFTTEDLREFRNAASAGLPGVDRDVGLDETEYRRALDDAGRHPAGSDEAQEAARVLAEARRQGKITLDPERHAGYLESRRQAASARAEALRSTLGELDADSPEAAMVRKALDGVEREVKDLEQRRADLDRAVEGDRRLTAAKIESLQQQRAAVPDGSPAARRIDQRIARLQGRTDIDVSPSRWNDMAQESYNEAYAQTTGRSAEGALQTVTQGKHRESFGDPSVLRGVGPDNLPDPGHAEQTASVPRVKEIENQHLAEAGHLTEGQNIQETARGYAKDMATKITPLLENDPRLKPDHLDRLRRMQAVMEKVGRGEIPPGQVDGVLQKAVPEIEGLTLAKATRIIDANFEAAIKWQKPPAPRANIGGIDPRSTRPFFKWPTPRANVGGMLATALDAEQVSQDFNRLLGAGASVEDAAFVAAAKAVAGAKMGEAYNPGISMAGALLPEAARKRLPDQFAGELIEKGHQAFKGLVEDIAASTVTGKVDFEKFNKAAQRIGDGEGVMADWMKAARFLGEEVARTDQTQPGGGAVDTTVAVLGNLRDDLVRMHQTGALGEQVAEMKDQAIQYVNDDLGPAAFEGKHGTPLQGYAQAAALAGEIMEDPSGFAEDLQRMWTHGGDAELMTEMLKHTDQTLSNTPAVGTVYRGWKNVGDFATKSEFREEMMEGAGAMAGEAGEWFRSSAASVARSIFNRFTK